VKEGYPKLVRRSRLKYDQVRSSHVLLMPERVVMLSATAAEILGLCDGARSVADIVRELEGRYPGNDLARDVQEFLDEAAGLQWLEPIAVAS
jgi:pyrroloquinoline quinone biosynthesis protein D